MKTIGFIGLGIMGRPMSKNLVQGGFTVIGSDINASFMAEAEKHGVKSAKSIAEMAAQCDMIITMLPSPAISKEVILGEGGISCHAKPGTLIVEMSSITPVVAKELALELEKKGIRFMDAPVSGGEPKAIDGTLAIMAGSSEIDFEEAKPVFTTMASTITRVGTVGAGSMTKLANQIIVAVNIAGVAEALTLAAKAGVDPALVFEAIRSGFAGSTVMEAKAPMMLNRDYEPGARIDIHIKDLVNVLETAHGISSPTPLTAQIMEMMQSLRANGLGGIDHSGLVRYYELIANVEVKRGS